MYTADRMPEMNLPSLLLDVPVHLLLVGQSSPPAPLSPAGKNGPAAMAERMNRKRSTARCEPFAERERPAAQHAVQPAERPLVEERQQCADARQHIRSACAGETRRPGTKGPLAASGSSARSGHTRWPAPQVTRDAERHFRQHRVHVGMPESEPGAQRLPDVDHQHQHRPRCNIRSR